METLSIPRDSVNIPALDDALRQALGSHMYGISTQPGLVLVHLADDTPSADARQAEQIVIDHDASRLTAEQQAKLDAQRTLQQARADNPTLLDVSAYAAADATIQALARKIHWLEQEIRDLRDL